MQMQEEISEGLVKSIISKIDDDVIRQSSFLLFSLLRKYPSEDSLNSTKDFLRSKGWILKTEDKEFIGYISQKSIIDIEKWIDFNLKRVR